MKRLLGTTLLLTTLMLSTGCLQPGDVQNVEPDPINDGGGNTESGQDNPDATPVEDPTNGDGEADAGDQPDGGTVTPAPIETPVENETPTPPVEEEVVQPSLVGIWQAGVERPDYLFGYQPITFIEFHENDTMTVYFINEANDFVTCETNPYVDFGHSLLSAYDYEYTQLALYDVSETELKLTDAYLQEHTLTRVAEVPDQFRCGTTERVERFEGLDEPSSSTNMAFDGTFLWYTNDAREVRSFDPSAGAFGVRIDFGNGFDYLRDVVGGNFWLGCNCGSEEVSLRDPDDNELVNIEVEDEFGLEPSTLTVDEVNNEMWISGYVRSERRYELVRVNLSSAPRQVLARHPFRSVDALEFSDGKLWAVDGQHLTQVDLLTGKGLKSYRLPRRMDWEAAAIRGDRVFLLGDDFDGNGVIEEVKLID